MKFKRTRYQFGCLQRKQRATGPDIWALRFREIQGDVTKQTSKTVGTVEQYPTRAQAWKAAESLRIAANPDNPNLQAVSFGALAERYKVEELLELRHSTQMTYSSHIDTHVLPKWGEYKISDVRPLAVEEWLKSLPFAGKTKGNLLWLMRRLFKCALRWGLLEGNNPMLLVQVRGVSKRQNQNPRALTVAECQRFLTELDEPYRTMVYLALASGLRVSELFALRWSDFNWQGSEMHVQRAVVDGVIGPVKTRYSSTLMPLDTATLDMLLRWRQRTQFNKDEDFLFASWRTSGRLPLRSTAVLEDYLKPAAERAGLGKIGWHTLRRTYATMVCATGTDVRTAQTLLRHADVRTTLNLYAQSIPQQMRDAQTKIGSMFVPDVPSEFPNPPAI